MGNRLAAGLAAAVLAAAAVSADVVSEFTPEVVEDAIAFGHGGSASGYLLPARLYTVSVVTPFRRISMAAAAAAKAGKTFDPGEVTPEMTRPEIELTVRPLPYKPTDIRTVVAEVDGATVTPLAQAETVDTMRDRKRKQYVLRGVVARFPLSVLKPGVRFRLKMAAAPDDVLEVPALWLEDVR